MGCPHFSQKRTCVCVCVCLFYGCCFFYVSQILHLGQHIPQWLILERELITEFCLFFLVRLSEESVVEDLSRLQSRVAELRVRAQADAEIEQQTRTFLEVRSHQCQDHIHRCSCVCSASSFIISSFRLQKWGWRKLRTSWKAYRRPVRPLWISSVKMTSPSNWRRPVLSSTASAIGSKEPCRWADLLNHVDWTVSLNYNNQIKFFIYLPEARAAKIWIWKYVITKTHKV